MNPDSREPLPMALRALLRQFRRQRPLRGGSILITIFGDAIAPRGGAVTLGSLISLAQPFGLTERLVRTSAARLARDGWLVARRDGRRSEYRLTPTGEDRFAEATRRIYGEIPHSWDGQWTLLVLPPLTGRRRQGIRDELRWLGFGQLSPGLFAHPNWSLERARSGLSRLEGAADALLLKSSSEGIDIDRRLVASGWDLGDLTRRYRRFVDTFTPVEAAVAAGSAPRNSGGAACASELDGEAAFVIRTLLIHEYRKIHLQDPLLPPALLPSDWVGAAAHELSRRLYSAVFPAAERYLSNTASTLSEPLPAANTSVHARFAAIAR
ncbi:MAG: Phenylacetic acid degradation operon negative regulatory protein PaaX [Gammaproteobacteria bacterium]|nr:Phenylacetic acid degradation operon negative regulatory protein PaaX [Gammaproteobacteria bacterium]